MPDPRGFLAHGRSLPAKRPVPVRITDWREVYTSHDEPALRELQQRWNLGGSVDRLIAALNG